MTLASINLSCASMSLALSALKDRAGEVAQAVIASPI